MDTKKTILHLKAAFMCKCRSLHRKGVTSEVKGDDRAGCIVQSQMSFSPWELPTHVTPQEALASVCI